MLETPPDPEPDPLKLSSHPLGDRRVMVRLDLSDDGQQGQAALSLRASLPTLRFALERGAKLILCGGRVDRRGKAESLAALGEQLSELGGWEIFLPDDCISDAARKVVGDLRPGQVCLLENLALHAGETNADQSFAQELLRFCDVYVNDAPRASLGRTSSVTLLPRLVRSRCQGLSLEAELGAAQRFKQSGHKTVLFGGSINDAREAFEAMLPLADRLLFSGELVPLLLRAQGLPIGGSSVNEDELAWARGMLARAAHRVIPTEDLYVLDSRGELVSVLPNEVTGAHRILAPGPKTLVRALQGRSETDGLLWFGHPAGQRHVAPLLEAMLAEASQHKAFQLFAGTSLVAPLLDRFSNDSTNAVHLSTMGSQLLQLLSGHRAPGLQALHGSSID